MKIAKIQTNNNIFASFAEKTLVFPDSDNDRLQNQPLSNEIESWVQENQNPAFDILVATLLCKKRKRKGSDVENILFYNLNNKQSMDNLISSAQKIIFQCKDEIWNDWPKNYTNYPYYYFYGLFDESKKDYEKYLLYNCGKWENVDEIIREIFGNNRATPVIRQKTKYCLKIKTPDKWIDNIEKLKKYIDCIIVYLNAKNIIEHSEPNKIITDKLNPSDDLLYYCEIEKNSGKSGIEVYICPISNNSQVDDKSCCYKRENLKNYPGFEEVN